MNRLPKLALLFLAALILTSCGSEENEQFCIVFCPPEDPEAPGNRSMIQNEKEPNDSLGSANSIDIYDTIRIYWHGRVDQSDTEDFYSHLIINDRYDDREFSIHLCPVRTTTDPWVYYPPDGRVYTTDSDEGYCKYGVYIDNQVFIEAYDKQGNLISSTENASLPEQFKLFVRQRSFSVAVRRNTTIYPMGGQDYILNVDGFPINQIYVDGFPVIDESENNLGN